MSGETAYLIVMGAVLWVGIVLLVAMAAVVLCGQTEAILERWRRVASLLPVPSPRTWAPIWRLELPLGRATGAWGELRWWTWLARARAALGRAMEAWRRSSAPPNPRERWLTRRREDDDD